MSQSQSQKIQEEILKEFFLDFDCSGSRIARKDKDGKHHFHLWKIYNKVRGDKDEMLYVVQYWENGSDGGNGLHAMPVTDIAKAYPDEAGNWEFVFGEEWEAKYGENPLVWSTGKREFETTPSKPIQKSKRSKSFGPIFGDIEEETQAGEPVDDEDPFSGGGTFSVAMRPPPLPQNRRLPGSSPTRAGGEEIGDGQGSSTESGSDEEDSIRPAARRARGGFRMDTAAFEESQQELEDDDTQDEEVIPDTQPRSDTDLSKYDEYSEKLIQAHSLSLHNLLVASLDLKGLPCDRWVTKRMNSLQCNPDHLQYALWLMLVAWDPLILKHLVRGDLPKVEKTNLDLKRRLKKLKNPYHNRTPCIYIHYFVNASGDSPIPRILQKILHKAKLYIAGLDKKHLTSAELAEKIDTAVKPPQKWEDHAQALAAAGERRYLSGPSRRIQADKCLDLIDVAEDRIRGLPLDQPLERAFTEVGFAIEPNTRLRNHADHVSSNYVMNLFEAISAAFWDKEYYMEQYVVFHIFHFTQAMYAEILASRFCLAYTTQGGGFSHEAAGKSHQGAVTKNKDEPEYYIRRQENLANDNAFLLRAKRDLDALNMQTEVYKRFVEVLDIEDDQRRRLKEDFVDRADEALIAADENERAALERMRADIEIMDPLIEIMRLAEELSDVEDTSESVE